MGRGAQEAVQHLVSAGLRRRREAWARLACCAPRSSTRPDWYSPWRPPPGSGLTFSLENSQSYAQWLAGTSEPVSSFPGRLSPDYARVVQRGPVPRHSASQAAIRCLSSVQRATRPVMVSRTARVNTVNPPAKYAWPVTCESCSGGLVSWPSAVVHNCWADPAVVPSGTTRSPVITAPLWAVHLACASGSPYVLPCGSSFS